MPILRTATGKEFPCDFMGVASGLVLYVKIEIDMNDILSVFCNPEETSVLQWIGTSGTIAREESGFTKFTGFDIMDGKCPIRIRMTKQITE